jgi:hypothetical protein
MLAFLNFNKCFSNGIVQDGEEHQCRKSGDGKYQKVS